MLHQVVNGELTVRVGGAVVDMEDRGAGELAMVPGAERGGNLSHWSRRNLSPAKPSTRRRGARCRGARTSMAAVRRSMECCVGSDIRLPGTGSELGWSRGLGSSVARGIIGKVKRHC